MHQKKAISLYFKIDRSDGLLLFILIIHILAFAGCWLNTLILSYRLILMLSVVISLFLHISVYNETKTVYLRYLLTEGWAITDSDQVFFPIEILQTTVITRLLTLLNYQRGSKKAFLLIFKDAMLDKDYKKLRATLTISSTRAKK